MKIGDPVLLTDPGLARLRAIMPDAPPNHYGAVADILPDGTIFVLLPIGEDDPAEHSQVTFCDPREVLLRTDLRAFDDALRLAAMAYRDEDAAPADEVGP